MTRTSKRKPSESSIRALKSSSQPAYGFRSYVGRLLCLLIAGVCLAVLPGEALALPGQINTPRLTSIVFPVSGPRLSSDFGKRVHPRFKAVRHHNGIDLAAPSGAPIRSMAGGTVVFADKYAGYGNLVVVRHDNGLTTHYGHCEKISVKTGQTVRPGAVLGTVGSTGVSTGPHLHLEVRFNGVPQDPLEHVPGLADGFLPPS